MSRPETVSVTCQGGRLYGLLIACDDGPIDRAVVWRSSRNPDRVITREGPLCGAHAGYLYQRAIGAGTMADVRIEGHTSA